MSDELTKEIVIRPWPEAMDRKTLLEYLSGGYATYRALREAGLGKVEGGRFLKSEVDRVLMEIRYPQAR